MSEIPYRRAALDAGYVGVDRDGTPNDDDSIDPRVWLSRAVALIGAEQREVEQLCHPATYGGTHWLIRERSPCYDPLVAPLLAPLLGVRLELAPRTVRLWPLPNGAAPGPAAAAAAAELGSQQGLLPYFLLHLQQAAPLQRAGVPLAVLPAPVIEQGGRPHLLSAAWVSNWATQLLLAPADAPLWGDTYVLCDVTRRRV